VTQLSDSRVAGLTLAKVRAGYDGREVLRGVDLTVGADELLVVLGPSGSGKSTLLRVVAGLEPVTGGRVLIGGQDVTSWRPGRRNVSMVFQSYALFPHLRVRENISFGLTVRDVPRAEIPERIERAAALTGCADLLDRRPAKLSGGERQRVALARALVREPDVFLLDEPMSNLDAELRAQTRTELKALHRRVGGSMVHVTHDQVEALVLGDRVAVLRDGVLEQVSTPAEIYEQPATRFVAAFIGSPPMNLVPVGGSLDRWWTGSLPLGGELGVRPEHLRLLPEPAAGPKAVVDHVDVVGSDAHVYLDVIGPVGPVGTVGTVAPTGRLVARVPAAERPAAGGTVGWTVADPSLLLAFDADGTRLP
jgi:ABC-type sugar transport system ATPase subunit